MPTNDAGRARLTDDELLRLVAIAMARLSASESGNVPDAELTRACAAACAVQARKLALFDGAGAVADDAERDALLAILDVEEDVNLDRAARLAPVTWPGHAVRASAFMAWDAGRVRAEAALGRAGDRLLLAILYDLATS